MSFEPTAREDVREVTWAWWLLLALGGLGVIAGVIVLGVIRLVSALTLGRARLTQVLFALNAQHPFVQAFVKR